MPIFGAAYRQSILKSCGRTSESESKICAKIASMPTIHNTAGTLRSHGSVYKSLLLIPQSKNISIFGGDAIPVKVRRYFLDDHEFACDRHIKFSLPHPYRFPIHILSPSSLMYLTPQCIRSQTYLNSSRPCRAKYPLRFAR
jgi:hypothetical protein